MEGEGWGGKVRGSRDERMRGGNGGWGEWRRSEGEGKGGGREGKRKGGTGAAGTGAVGTGGGRGRGRVERTPLYSDRTISYPGYRKSDSIVGNENRLS